MSSSDFRVVLSLILLLDSDTYHLQHTSSATHANSNDM